MNNGKFYETDDSDEDDSEENYFEDSEYPGDEYFLTKVQKMNMTMLSTEDDSDRKTSKRHPSEEEPI